MTELRAIIGLCQGLCSACEFGRTRETLQTKVANFVGHGVTWPRSPGGDGSRRCPVQRPEANLG